MQQLRHAKAWLSKYMHTKFNISLLIWLKSEERSHPQQKNDPKVDPSRLSLSSSWDDTGNTRWDETGNTRGSPTMETMPLVKIIQSQMETMPLVLDVGHGCDWTSTPRWRCFDTIPCRTWLLLVQAMQASRSMRAFMVSQCQTTMHTSTRKRCNHATSHTWNRRCNTNRVSFCDRMLRGHQEARNRWRWLQLLRMTMTTHEEWRKTANECITSCSNRQHYIRSGHTTQQTTALHPQRWHPAAHMPCPQPCCSWIWARYNTAMVTPGSAPHHHVGFSSFSNVQWI